MRILLGLIGLAAWAFQAAQAPAPPPRPAAFQEFTHFSQVLGATRVYRVALPAAYAASAKRYPVIYWLQGYEQPDEQREAAIVSYAANHEVILVEAGPVETVGEFPLYFPELAARIDSTFRTLAGRRHRAVTGFSAGGFMALWVAGKYPDLLGSASSFMGPTQALAGPRNLDTEFPLEDIPLNYEGVRTRLVIGTRDYLRFYHRRLNSTWLFARAGHETEAYPSDHATPDLAKTLDFHLRAFADPLPEPAAFQHADAYPNFTVWGWEVTSDRREPGFTLLENVSAAGFRSSVREWLPAGRTLPKVRLSVVSPPLFTPGTPHSASCFRLRDRAVRRVALRADARGRLAFDLDGDAWEVSLDGQPRLSVTGCQPADTDWSTAGSPIPLRVRFTNVGPGRSATASIRWESPDRDVRFEPAVSRLFGLASGESADLPVTVTAPAGGRTVVRIDLVDGANRLPILVPVFPAAPSPADFRIADGLGADVFRHATERAGELYGEGNGDGHAAPGESFAVLLPDAGAWRPAEIFTSDPCVDLSLRAADSWTDYDRSGAAVFYSLPSIRPECTPGHVVHALARVLIPNPPDHRYRYAAIEFPVWYRRGEEPK